MQPHANPCNPLPKGVVCNTCACLFRGVCMQMPFYRCLSATPMQALYQRESHASPLHEGLCAILVQAPYKRGCMQPVCKLPSTGDYVKPSCKLPSTMGCMQPYTRPLPFRGSCVQHSYLHSKVMLPTTIPLGWDEDGSGNFTVEIKTFHAIPSQNLSFKLYALPPLHPNPMEW